MGGNVLDLPGPAFRIPSQSVDSPFVVGQRSKAGLRDIEAGSIGRRFEPELYERGWLVRVIEIRIAPIGTPRVGKQPLVIHGLHGCNPPQVLVARVGDLAAADLADDERALQIDAEPLTEFRMVRQRPPDACA